MRSTDYISKYHSQMNIFRNLILNKLKIKDHTQGAYKQVECFKTLNTDKITPS